MILGFFGDLFEKLAKLIVYGTLSLALVGAILGAIGIIIAIIEGTRKGRKKH